MAKPKKQRPAKAVAHPVPSRGRPPGPVPVPSSWNATNDDVVAPYVFLLRAAGLRRPDFDRVIAELTANKSAKKAELLRIASQYCGFPLRPRSRNESLNVIKTRFNELLRFEGK